MKNLYFIFASQDYQIANHKNLWQLMSSQNPDDCFVIVNIPADQIVSRIKRKTFRIKESKEQPKKISKNLYIFRPIFLIRPEIAPSLFYKSIAKNFLKQISMFNMSDYRNVFCLVYSALWIEILRTVKTNFKFGYYLFDEVRLDADTCKINKKRTKADKIACNTTDIIFAMSKGVAENRKDHFSKIIIIGNGSSRSDFIHHNEEKKKKSVAFIGNFRSWIDKELLSNLINAKKEYEFHIVGPIEKNMQSYLKKLMQQHSNVFYDGVKSKELIKEEYGKHICILIPYIQNEFIYCTRPIKIVESVFERTPVVTIPISGFEESEYIRFASTANDFSNQIDDLYNYPPDFNTENYLDFIKHNSWETISSKIIEAFERVVDKVN